MVRMLGHELIASGGTALTTAATAATLTAAPAARAGDACAACIVEYGADPATATVIAVVLGLLYRVAADWYDRRQRRRTENAP